MAKKEEIATPLFDEFKIDPKKYMENLFEIDPTLKEAFCGGKDWDEMPALNKAALIGFLTHRICAEKLGLKTSIWNPRDPIETLINEMKKNGPLCVGGAFGTPMYLTPASKLNHKVEGREVYGWNKSDPRATENRIAHMVLLVGAEVIKERGFVYFLDPFDDSDPSHPEAQKIYVMSYERLTSPDSIFDRFGMIRTDAPPEVGYAMYMPQEQHD